MVIASGTYTGTGSSQTITLSYSPDFLWVWGPDGAGSYIRTSSFTGTNSMRVDNILVTDAITALGATGFTVGTSSGVNASGKVFIYFAIENTGADDVAVGSYTGNATDNRNIVISPAFQPDLVAIFNTPFNCLWRTSAMPAGDNSKWFDQIIQTDRIQAFNASITNLRE